MTRAEHLQWCKDRALAYVRDGDLVNAVASMGSDLTKHPETAPLMHGPLGAMCVFAAMQAHQGDKESVERFINGFR